MSQRAAVPGVAPGSAEGLEERAEVSVVVGKGLHLAISATRPEVRLGEPLYAINLLDEKRPWAYGLYGLLALPSVRKVGGRPLVKAKRRGELLAGKTEDGRDTLLVVSYPDARAFLSLITRPLFAALGWLRRRGIRGFQFGFAERLDGAAESGRIGHGRGETGEELLLVHAVNAALGTPLGRERVERLEAQARAAGAELAFAGYRSAIVGARRQGHPSFELGAIRQAPPLPWEGVFVFSAASREALAAFFEGPGYREFRDTLVGEVAGIYAREL